MKYKYAEVTLFSKSTEREITVEGRMPIMKLSKLDGYAPIEVEILKSFYSDTKEEVENLDSIESGLENKAADELENEIRYNG